MGAIGAISVAGAGLWFWQIGSKSLFQDEGFTASTVLRPWGSLLRLSIEHEATGLVHALLLRALTLFGESEATLRSLSALSLIALVPIVGAIGWRLASPRVGVLASLLLVVNGTVAAYAHYSRTYALTMLLAGVATLLFVFDVDEPRRSTLLGWAAGCLLLSSTHIIGVLLVGCHLASLWFLPAGQRLLRRRGIAACAFVLLSLPLALLIGSQGGGMHGVSNVRPGVYRDVMYTFTGRAGLIGLAAFGVMIFLAARVTVRTWRVATRGREAWAHGLLVCWSVLPTLTLVILSPFSPLVGRYLLFSMVGVFVYGAVGLDDAIRGSAGSSSLRGWQRFVPLALVLGAGVYGLVYWYSDGDAEDWRGASRYVFGTAEQDDRILFANDSVRLYFEYYRRGDESAVLPRPAYPTDPWGGYETGDEVYRSFDQQDIDELVADPTANVWVVVGERHDHVEDVPDLLSSLTSAYTEVERREFDGDVAVIRFAPS
jgi:4-amino-4-deoxy-L-arabinose transferase-like glycosyltransferase